MAAIAPSWREGLKSEILSIILEGFSLEEADRYMTTQPAGKDREQLIKTLNWCFTVLGKQVTDLNEEQLKPEGLRKLVTETLHLSVKKVAKKYLEQFVSHLKTAIMINGHIASARRDLKEMGRDDRVIIMGASPSELITQLNEKIALMKAWHKDPSLILPNLYK